MSARFLLASTFIALVLLSGCAVTYQNENRRGIFGFAWVEYSVDSDVPQSPVALTGKVTIEHGTPAVREKTLGFYLDTSENSSGVGLGYRDVLVVVPHWNAQSDIQWETDDPLSSRYTVTEAD